MNRRNALKNIGLTLGYTAVLPSALSILQSCKTETEIWTPQFFSVDEGVVIQNLVDLMLPTTKNSPGALEVNVPEFIDLYALKVYDAEKAKKYKEEIQSIMNEIAIPQTGVTDLKKEDYDFVLSKYLKASKEEQKQFVQTKNIVFQALIDLRNQAIWAFKNSEEIGENVLAYDPIPGIQKGCISVNEATGGKAWSL
ncbi:gluconate 2-dehydrogenase subunit 3 family protein [Algibacter mikhailovii]|uniref:Gluconate 2-dehydrogenase subunit 3 family protein n=1 Tax=Algibacter mikhailovii TaxID=425498 RepID=A0A918QV54_9FLAO|nr:gluconate 2-dehydrogenase subunit 3 family protein [Algibacter mikhailovii]GGZ73367.1 hypothetical protein GCM10007028_08280 [Algibacter mikhailovii]